MNPSNNHRYRLGNIALFIVLILSCCKEKENEICLDCANGEIKSSFDDRLFRFGISRKLEFELYPFDTSKSGTQLGYGFCVFTGQSTLDTIDVIQASGNVKWACNKVDSFLLLKKFNTVDVCQTTPPVI